MPSLGIPRNAHACTCVEVHETSDSYQLIRFTPTHACVVCEIGMGVR